MPMTNLIKVVHSADKLAEMRHTSEVNYVRMVLHCAVWATLQWKSSLKHQILSIQRTVHCSALPGLLGGVEQMVCGQLHHDQDIIPVCKYIANTNTRQSHNTNLVRSESRFSLTLKQTI